MGAAHRISSSRDGMAGRTAEEKKEDFGGKDRCVLMGGAHQISSTRDGMASWTTEKKKEDFGGKSYSIACVL